MVYHLGNQRVTPCNGLKGGGGGSSAQKVYGVYERVGISPVEVYERVGKSVILVCKMT